MLQDSVATPCVSCAGVSWCMQVRKTDLYMDELTRTCNSWKDELMRYQSEAAAMFAILTLDMEPGCQKGIL